MLFQYKILNQECFHFYTNILIILIFYHNNQYCYNIKENYTPPNLDDSSPEKPSHPVIPPKDDVNSNLPQVKPPLDEEKPTLPEVILPEDIEKPSNPEEVTPIENLKYVNYTIDEDKKKS